MKTNSRVRTKKSAKGYGSKDMTPNEVVQHASKKKAPSLILKYLSMEEEILKIQDPVSFDKLKEFYDISK